MIPAVAAGAAAVAMLLSYAFAGKKKGKGKDGGTIEVTTPGVEPGVVKVDPSALSPEEALKKTAEAGAAITKAAVDVAVKAATSEPTTPTPTEVTAKSPGWPAVPSAGSTSGAVSVSKTGEVDSAFDQLVAQAIAKADIPALRDLATQAENRGLLDAAELIRAEIARLTKTAPPPTVPLPTVPLLAETTSPLGRATISMAAGSRGPDVVAWQSVVKVKQDGIFGPITDRATRAWQKAHPPLAVDGIVGPKSWARAYQLHPELATQPRVNTAPQPAPTATPTPVVAEPEPTASTSIVVLSPTGSPTYVETPPTIKRGSTGTTVKRWQGIIGVATDGIFGPITETRTKAWQAARPPLVVDGIVGPKTWEAAITGKPAPVSVTPAATTTAVSTAGAPEEGVRIVPVESDSRKAARELTAYLNSIGGLAGRFREDKAKVKGYQARMGLTADGIYGRDSAKGAILQGYVPVVPYYWPRTNTSAAKAEFSAYVKTHAASDPQRKAQWDKLLSDIQRA